MTPGRPRAGFFGLLRVAALTAVLAGAAGSVILMLRAGRRNNSRLLILLFAIWVLAPITALVWAWAVSEPWSILTQATLYSVMLVLALGELAIYGGAALSPRAKAASVYVMVPTVSWLLIAIVLHTAALTSGRLSRRGDGA